MLVIATSSLKKNGEMLNETVSQAAADTITLLEGRRERGKGHRGEVMRSKDNETDGGGGSRRRTLRGEQTLGSDGPQRGVLATFLLSQDFFLFLPQRSCITMVLEKSSVRKESTEGGGC